jgi:hypothetical protein
VGNYNQEAMALTKCPECGKDVSSQAPSCPHCGFPLASQAATTVPPVVPPVLDSTQPKQPKPAPTIPLAQKTDKDRIKKGCLGCAGLIVLLVIILAVIGSFLGDDKTTPGSATQDNASAEKKQTKAAWKAKLGSRNQVFAVTGTTIQMTKSDFIQLMGEPDRTETLNGQSYWYYECSDGTVQIECQAAAVNAAGIIQGQVNDY